MNEKYQRIRANFDRSGYVFFTGKFNMNLFAVRGKDRVPDAFDDTLYVVYEDSTGEPVVQEFPCTVDPGIPWLVAPMNPGGAAAIAPGQYRRAWKIGKFRGTDALIQVGNFRIFRDNDKNKTFDYRPESVHTSQPTDGIFLHEHFQTFDEARIIDRSSAGCVVPKQRYGHRKLMRILNLQKFAGLGDTFTFTLFDEINFII